MRAPQESSFDERLNNWISSQGFWFQLRYATGKKSVLARLVSRLVHVSLRLLVLMAVAALGTGVYLMKRVDLKAFRTELPDAAARALGAENAELHGFRRSGARVFIHRVAAVGGENAFYYDLEARGVRYKMGLFDGLIGRWDAGPVTVTAARLEVKAGADADAEAVAAGEALFGAHDWFGFPLLEVLDCSVGWGYSERTRGSIQRSHLIAQRLDRDWLLQFRGGRFSQNWLRRLEIDELVVRLAPGMMVIEKGEFRRDDGRVLLTGTVKGGAAPEVALEMEFDQLPLSAVLPVEARPFVQGSMSGTAKIGGSTNSQEGVTFDCEVLLGGRDSLVLRDRAPLLQALTVVDMFNSYRKIDFTEGSFRLVTGSGGMAIDRLQLEAPDFMRMTGRFETRPPTVEEVARSLAEGPAARGAGGFFPGIGDEISVSGKGDEDDDGSIPEFSLRRAAKAREPDQLGIAGGAPGALPNLTALAPSFAHEARDRHARMVRFEGGVLIEIPGDAFERSRRLRESLPADPSTGRIPLEVPLSGSLFDLTFEQAEELYAKGRRSD